MRIEEWLIMLGQDLGISYLGIGLLAGLSNTKVRNKHLWMQIPYLKGTITEVLINIILIVILWPYCLRINRMKQITKRINRRGRHARIRK